MVYWQSLNEDDPKNNLAIHFGERPLKVNASAATCRPATPETMPYFVQT